ncbi:hypothetical protein BAL199_06739 [alpha proteobacterium BAL199]|jgi:hypothetical protein|nr:hypothetical protein BAL199_06739 [alpha proteobacterium BAL199]
MTDASPTTNRRMHLIFDLQRGRLVAREFLRELSAQSWLLQVTGASRRHDLDPMHRETVMVETMRKAQIALVLITPAASTSRNVVEEIRYAKHANLRLAGVLLAGSTAHTQLPDGLHRSTVVGWDWGALKKAVL